MLQFQLLFLVGLANGAPILAEYLLHRRLDYPIDFRAHFIDGRPLFGRSKTIRGIVAALVTATTGASIMGLPISLGAWIGFGAMAGDLLSSFFKRRLGIPASGMALGLDQIPEVLFPLLLVRPGLNLHLADILALTVLFVVIELLISRVLFRLRIRKQPY